MKPATIPITLLGTNTVIAERLARHPDFAATATSDVDSPTGLVVYLPESGAVTDGTATDTATRLLSAGHDVVTTTPLDRDAVAEACRTGRSTFHATGGLPAAVAVRICRAFAGAWRDIAHVRMTEFRDPTERSIPEADYEAGLHALAAAVFPDLSDLGARCASSVEQTDELRVHRSLGPRVSYDSVWADPGAGSSLRYRLTTATAASGAGHTTIQFDSGPGPHVIDHLVAVGVLHAIRATYHSAPGVLGHDFSTDHVQPDGRLVR